MAGKLKCNSCGGTYPDTTQPGSVPYFHVCPDKIVNTPEIINGSFAIITPATFKPTPNPRNENLTPDPAKTGAFVMVSAGSGVTPV